MPRERVWKSHPLILQNLDREVNQRLDVFRQIVDDEHISWLTEVVNEAKKAFSNDSYQLLPKTPCMKRKRGAAPSKSRLPSINTAGISEDSTAPPPASDASPVLGNANHASTFMDTGNHQNKKLKIDMSAICETSTLNSSAATKKAAARKGSKKVSVAKSKGVRSSRRLKSKASTEPVTAAIEERKSLVESKVEFKAPPQVQSILVVDTPSPPPKPSVKPVASPSPTKEQQPIEKPLTLAEQFAKSAANAEKAANSSITKTPVDPCKQRLFTKECLIYEDEAMEVVSESPCIEETKYEENVTIPMDDVDPVIEDPPLKDQGPTTAVNATTSNTEAATIETPDDTVTVDTITPLKTMPTSYPTGTYVKTNPTKEVNNDLPVIDMEPVLPTAGTPLLQRSATYVKEVPMEDTESYYSPAPSVVKPVVTSSTAGQSSKSETIANYFANLLKKNQPAKEKDHASGSHTITSNNDTNKPSEITPVATDRRGTYKLMMQQKEEHATNADPPSYSSYSAIRTDTVSIHKRVDDMMSEGYHSPARTGDTISVNTPGSGRKGPKIIKPVKGSNIVTGIKSFIKRADTPKKETEEEKIKRKEAELEKKQIARKRIVEEARLKKQQEMEDRKKAREDRERRFAEAQARRVAEEEERKKQMEKKAAQVSKNRELIKKKKELEDRLKKKARDEKAADIEAKRKQEEDDQLRRAREIYEDEQRRQEVLKRKQEHEEQERMKQKQEHIRAEKERLRLLEEERQLDGERKRREFLEREQHRLEVEKKMKEEREKERLEKLRKEERQRQAEREIEEAKFRQLEQELERERMKESIKLQIQQAKQTKVHVDPHKIMKSNQTNHTNHTTVTYHHYMEKENITPQESSVSAVFTKPAPVYYDPPVIPLANQELAIISYDIDDLNSDDSTDDESEPAQTVPKWASGRYLKEQLMQQFLANVDPDLIFVNCMKELKLEEIFKRKKERYFKRTSSAHWTSPIMKGGPQY